MATKTLIVIFQRGGMDGLNALVPHADGHYYDLRPAIAVGEPGSADGALDLDGYFGLHPALAPLKPLYDGGWLAAVHATGGPDLDRSHFSAQAGMEIASGGVIGGWVGRHLLATAGAGRSGRRIRAISIGTALDQALAGSPDSAAVASSADFRIRSREPELWEAALPLLHAGIADGYVAQGERVFSVLDAFRELRPHEIEPAADASYPAGAFGRAMLQAAQYIKSGLGIEAIGINLGGWDHHANEGNALPPKLQELAQGMAALRTDLAERFDDVVVVTMSEFGRRAAENAAQGTDHGSGNAMFVLGGRVNGGRVIADWPGLQSAALDDGALRITTDYRNVLGEILSQGFGNQDLGSVFPGVRAASALGLLLG
ncbi:DUF1501 domain-containing protein [Sinimarinibacterium flocculans]|uniref:DUF1501 domain-containing protein n=1 Tax=Sinimarinibacterium flocculans TaxID=985250 RepID=UPI0035133DF6